jgi:hypothetical protein
MLNSYFFFYSFLMGYSVADTQILHLNIKKMVLH